LPPTQPPQFQIKEGLGSEVPFQVITVVALVVEGSTQILVKEALIALVGTGLTVTNCVTTGEVQAGEPGFTSCKVIVLVPVVFQDIVWGPCPLGLPPIQPSQFHEYVGVPEATPVQVSVVVALVVEGSTQITLLAKLKFAVGVGLTVINTLVMGEVQVGTSGFTT
jgi:hypothetical protein